MSLVWKGELREQGCPRGAGLGSEKKPVSAGTASVAISPSCL